MINRITWGPLSRKEADDATNASNTALDLLLYSLTAITSQFGVPGWVLSAADLAVILGIDDMPVHEGDHGSDTTYYDPEESKYWRLVYLFDEDGNIISHQQYFSWDGVNWAMVVNETSYPSEEESENQ